MKVLHNDKGKSVIIPYEAVVAQMGEYFVFVINGNKVSQKKIDMGRTLGDSVIVKGGLKSGEQIVTEGVQKLRDNAPVIVGSSGGNGKATQSKN